MIESEEQEEEDHDQRFKVVIQEFLPEFMVLFYPEWARQFDFTKVVFLKQDSYPRPPRGKSRRLDIAAQLPIFERVMDPSGRRVSHLMLIIHIEIESKARSTDIKPRMLQSYVNLRREYQIPVLPICLFLRVGLDGIGWDEYREEIWGYQLLLFRYAYIGLKGLNGLEYLDRSKLLGVALSSLMKLPKSDRARIQAEGLDWIARSGENIGRQDILAECFATYMNLSPTEQVDFDRLMAERFPEDQQMHPVFEKFRNVRDRYLVRKEGIEEGLEKGRESLLSVARKLLEKKFGILEQPVLDRLAGLSIDRVEALLETILDANSLADLGLA